MLGKRVLHKGMNTKTWGSLGTILEVYVPRYLPATLVKAGREQEEQMASSFLSSHSDLPLVSLISQTQLDSRGQGSPDDASHKGYLPDQCRA